ncbi:hypothetical protein N0V90_008417 [Kalmusia sp. IMI 367209]|nr:hypothetical protein N0V90_008417 [Kalmusia sp. IMI 367209]
MPPPFPTVQKFLDANKNTETQSLLVTFPSGTQIITPATPASKSSTQQPPTLALSSTCLRTHVPGAKYIAVSLDLDAPSPSLHIASPILHYLHTDLTATTSPFAPPAEPMTKIPTKESWVRLEAAGVAEGGKGTLEKPLAGWLPPTPPGFSAPHRYVFSRVGTAGEDEWREEREEERLVKGK